MSDVMLAMIAKRSELECREYIRSCRIRYGIDGAPPSVRERWKTLEPIIEHAFHYGFASGGICSAELESSRRNS